MTQPGFFLQMKPFSVDPSQFSLPDLWTVWIVAHSKSLLCTTDLIHIGWVTTFNHVVNCLLDIYLEWGEIWNASEHHVSSYAQFGSTDQILIILTVKFGQSKPDNDHIICIFLYYRILILMNSWKNTDAQTIITVILCALYALSIGFHFWFIFSVFHRNRTT